MDGFFTRQEVLGDRTNPAWALLRAFSEQEIQWKTRARKSSAMKLASFAVARDKRSRQASDASPATELAKSRSMRKRLSRTWRAAHVV